MPSMVMVTLFVRGGRCAHRTPRFYFCPVSAAFRFGASLASCASCFVVVDGTCFIFVLPYGVSVSQAFLGEINN
jgi:hypothetical protein